MYMYTLLHFIRYLLRIIIIKVTKNEFLYSKQMLLLLLWLCIGYVIETDTERFNACTCPRAASDSADGGRAVWYYASDRVTGGDVRGRVLCRKTNAAL